MRPYILFCLMALFILACKRGTNSSLEVLAGEPIVGDLPLDEIHRQTDRKAMEIVSGDRHICVLLDDGTIKCWGYDKDGQLNIKSARNASRKAYDVRLAQFSKITASYFHTCGILKSAPFEGIPVCFGKEGEWLNVPHEKVKDIAAGYELTCFIKEDEKLACIGEKFNILNKNENLIEIKPEELVKYGIDPFSKKENQDFSQKKFKNLKVRFNRVCAQSSDDGIVYCMGNNDNGSGESITQKFLDYEDNHFILENGERWGVGIQFGFRPLKNVANPEELKFKKIFFYGQGFLTGPGNVYNDGSKIPENTLVTTRGFSAEGILGAAIADINYETIDYEVICMIKENNKIRCEVLDGYKPSGSLLSDIPKEIAD